MALNTPKRIKTFNTFIQSPGSDYTDGEWPDSFDGNTSANTNCSIVMSGNDATNSSIGARNGNGSLSPASSCDSPEFSIRHSNNSSGGGGNNSSAGSAYNLFGSDGRENRRGRPRSEALTTLMIEGSTSPSAIKCGFCNRVFPREKSLQAHLRTHTGERPYHCDYPSCTRAFTQSGQLKTHQRLHTGERPFMCSAPTCQMRFTHANRHCPEHPYDQLKRCDDFVIQAATEQNHDVIKWLEKYKMEKEDRTPTRKTPKRTKTLLCDDTSNRIGSTEKSNENYRIGMDGNENKLPLTPNNRYKSRKGLMVELDMNAGLGASPITGNKMKPTPKVIHWQEPLSQEEDSADEFETPAQSTFNPKKRWLREAWQNDLAKPLEPMLNAQTIASDANKSINNSSFSYQTLSPPSPPPLSPPTIANPVSQQKSCNTQLNPNQMRPTVLMVASKDKTMPLVNIPSASTNHDQTNQLANTHSPQKKHQHLSTSKFTNNHCNQQALYPPHSQQYPNQSNVTQQTPSLNSSIFSIKYQKAQLEYDAVITGDIITNERDNVIAANPIVLTNERVTNPEIVKNRKWLGALALMQLAAEENNSPVSSSSLSSSSSSSSTSSSSSSSSTLPLVSIKGGDTKTK